MTHRILSIDGGGIKGVFAAAFLSAIEEEINHNVAECFDLIVGTSTGGIIALGLGLGYSANDLVKFYEILGPAIFKGNKSLRWLKRLFCAKYDHGPLKDSLSKQFQDKKLGSSNVRLVIPALNLENGQVYLYKTAHHPRLVKDYKVPVIEIALATASAPSYFPALRTSRGIPLVDGGIWANNPVAVAAIEAVGIMGWDRRNIKILSLGCTSEPLDVDWGRRRKVGSLYWGIKISELFLTAQSSAALSSAQLLIGKENVHRINPCVPKGRYQLDGINEILSLKGAGEFHARHEVVALKETFFNSIAEKFIPCH